MDPSVHFRSNLPINAGTAVTGRTLDGDDLLAALTRDLRISQLALHSRVSAEQRGGRLVDSTPAQGCA